ncbi:hypothetical protein TNCT_524761 [Trichonephila clavata]|uniref:Uncharacterized protein n=1 Tax=Trichonephila clavata TaxID=2740835 RepID=A0A8X6KPM8_TRICU|nr:hypothetical protein TNCT_524761 [Trichonephila clavata]
MKNTIVLSSNSFADFKRSASTQVNLSCHSVPKAKEKVYSTALVQASFGKPYSGQKTKFAIEELSVGVLFKKENSFHHFRCFSHACFGESLSNFDQLKVLLSFVESTSLFDFFFIFKPQIQIQDVQVSVLHRVALHPHLHWLPSGLLLCGMVRALLPPRGLL